MIVLVSLLVRGGPVCTHIFIYPINMELTLGVTEEQRLVRKPSFRLLPAIGITEGRKKESKDSETGLWYKCGLCKDKDVELTS